MIEDQAVMIVEMSCNGYSDLDEAELRREMEREHGT